MFRASSRGLPQALGRGGTRSSSPRSGLRGLALLAGSVGLAACSVVLDFGDDKQLVASAGTAGSAGASSGGSGSGGEAATAGSAPGGSGGDAGVAGDAAGGSAGAGGNGGTGGSPDAGLCGTDAAPVGPGSGNQLFFYFDAKDQPGAANDGDCSKEDARLTPLPGTTAADCDFPYGTGKEWIQLFREESIACAGCLSPTPNLWVEFLLQYKSPVSAGGTVVFQPMRGAASAANATYPTILINAQHQLGLKCGDTEQYSQIKVNESAILMLTYEYDFAARVGRLYLRGTSEGYAIGQLNEPNVEVACTCSEPADGFFMRGIPGTGELLYDEIRAAENHAAIDDSY